MKKASRFAALLAAVMLFGSVAAMPALAEDAPSTPVPTATAEPTVTPAPTDNGQSAPNNSGSAYIIAQTVTDAAGGEITTIDRDSRFNLILRVADYGAYNNFIPADQISARINSSAFTFTGNAEVGQLYEETDANGAGYYSYVLLFRDVIYNGGDNNFNVDISYVGSILAQGSVSHAMGQCVTTTKDNSRTPSILVRGNKITTSVQGAAAGTALAGNECTLTLDLLSTSGDEALTDLLVTLALPEGVTLASGNSTAYIGSMATGSGTSVSFQLLTGANFTGGVATLGVSLSAVGKDTGVAVSSSTNVTVPVMQPERFELTNLEAPETMYLGEEGYVSLTFVNKGKSSINNLSAEISGENIANPGQSQYLGNIAAGTENSVDFNVKASNAGTLKGTITLSYEDDQGNVKTMTKDFSCDVQEMPNNNDGMDDFDPGIVEPEKTGLPIWAKALIGVAVVAVIAGVVVFIRKKRKEKALGTLEDEDEDI